MNSCRLWQHTQNLHRFELDEVQALGGGSGHGLPFCFALTFLGEGNSYLCFDGLISIFVFFNFCF